MITLSVFDDAQHKRGLLQIIQDVHMTYNGSMERSNLDQSVDITALKCCRLNWESPISFYDVAIYNLISCVLIEVGENL